TCRKPPFPAGSNERPRTLNPPSAGWPFCPIIGKLSLPWISSPSPLSPLGCCTASSSSAMIAGAFCTSTSLAIPPAPGSRSSCEKLFPTIRRPDFSNCCAIQAQQLREAFPYDSAPRFLLFDHDAKYGLEVPASIRSLKMTPVRTSIRSPWQNGVAERWVGSCRRDLLDHVIALDERHLKRLLSQYVSYYHHDRTHLGLDKQTPAGRARSR